MDIQVASNFERFLYFGFDQRRCAGNVSFMKDFGSQVAQPASARELLLREQPISATEIDTEGER